MMKGETEIGDFYTKIMLNFPQPTNFPPIAFAKHRNTQRWIRCRCLVRCHMAERWTVSRAHHARVPLGGCIHLSLHSSIFSHTYLFSSSLFSETLFLYHLPLRSQLQSLFVFLFCCCFVFILNMDKSLKLSTCIATLGTQNRDPCGHCPTGDLPFSSLHSKESYLSF